MENDYDAVIGTAESLCKKYEGFRSNPYLCPAGVPTIGYGTTIYPNNKMVRLDDQPIDRQTALVLLRWDLRHRRAPAVMALLQHRLDDPVLMGTIVDFVYNFGIGAFKNSTLRKRINAGRYDEVAAQIRKWNKAGGKVLPGLTARRADEAAPWEKKYGT